MPGCSTREIRWVNDPVFDSLQRWKPGDWSEPAQRLSGAVAAMDQARRPIPHLDRVVMEFPELRILGGHIGAD